MEAELANVEDQTVCGELGLGTLPALIRRLHEECRSGILRIQRGDRERRVYFKWGAVIFASSDRAADRLDRRLAEFHGVSQEVLDQAHENQRQTGRRFGEILVELGVLDEDELLLRVEEQVREIVTFLFSLHDGSYCFESVEEPVAPDLMLDLPMREIIQDGICSITDPIALRIIVGSMTDYLHVGREMGVDPASVKNPSEAFVISCVDGRTTIIDLLSISPMGDLETFQTISAMLAVGLVEARPEPLSTSRPEQPSEVIADMKLKAPVVAKLPAPLTPAPEPEQKTEPRDAPLPEAVTPRIEPRPAPEPVARTQPAPRPIAVPEATPELEADQKRQAATKSYMEACRLFNDEHYREAIEALEEAIRLDSAEAPYHRLLGRACSTHPQSRAVAVDHFQKAIALDALDASSYWHLGELYEDMGKNGEAKNMFRKVLGLDRKHSGARKKLASGGGIFSELKSLFTRSLS